MTRLLFGFALLKKEGGNLYENLKLVIIGNLNKFNKYYKCVCEKLNISKYVIVYENLQEKDLIKIYQGANLFVFPSLMEGFGLPPIEAIKSNTITVTTAYQSALEIFGKNMYYIDFYDYTLISYKIKLILEQSDLEENYLKELNNLINKFSCQNFWEEINKIYRELI